MVSMRAAEWELGGGSDALEHAPTTAARVATAMRRGGSDEWRCGRSIPVCIFLSSG
jgi:hypothetical protein